MKRSLALITALFLVAAVTAAGFSATKKVVKESVFKLQGKVVSVDTTANTITVSVKKTDTVVDTDTNTKIKIGKDVKTLADIKAGDTAVIKYKNADSKKLALSINIAAAPVKVKK